MGRQWPPTPGPGVNGMNPNGLVEAASIASHTLMPRPWANIASSFTRAMFTCRKVFSMILASSASRGEETATVFDDAAVEGLHRRERIGVDTRDDLRGTDQGGSSALLC